MPLMLAVAPDGKPSAGRGAAKPTLPRPSATATAPARGEVGKQTAGTRTPERCMTQDDDRVIPIEEALRRRRARELQAEEEERLREEREKAEHGEVRISDAMSRLLEGETAGDERPSATELRLIVEREFSEDADDEPAGGHETGRGGKPTGTGGDQD
jgi:hypothetical protein